LAVFYWRHYCQTGNKLFVSTNNFPVVQLYKYKDQIWRKRFTDRIYECFLKKFSTITKVYHKKFEMSNGISAEENCPDKAGQFIV